MATTRKGSKRRLITVVLVAVVAVPAVLFGAAWVWHRFTHSISNDAFIESHLVNVAPQVAGELVEVLVQEQQAVRKGDLLARVDPAIYRHEVDLAIARRELAVAALAKAEADLEVLTADLPQQVARAQAQLDAAREDEAKAAAALAMIEQDVEQAIVAAGQSLDATEAQLTFATEDFDRFEALYREGTVTERRYQAATKDQATAKAETGVAKARLIEAEADRKQIDIARQELAARRSAVAAATADLELAELGDLEVEAGRKKVDEQRRLVGETEQALRLAEVNLKYTHVVAPFDGVIAKKWRHLGDYAHTGQPLFSLYNQDFLYVTVQLEETRLEGVNPGCYARLDVDAYDEPFYGRVVWVGSATGANFSLIPRDVASGEFTYVVQRVPTRISIERDERWSKLKPGLSVTVDIEHGPGDAEWAAKAWELEAEEAFIGEEAAR